MTTTVTTVTKSAQVFTRTWRDLDPKVRNALYTAVAAIVLAAGGFLAGTLGLHALLLAIAVGLLPVISAYVTTSKHKDVIRKDAAVAAKAAHDLAPLVKELAPEAAPVVDEALDAVDTINAALTTTQILDTVPAAPVPASGAGQ